jgi:site-specific DNA recombinase
MARTSRKKHTVISESQTEAIRAYNTAIYVRLSVEDNGKESDSIESQTQMIEEYIAERPYLHKVAVFSDNGYTGTDFMRPEFMRMMEAVKDGLVNCIIVKDAAGIIGLKNMSA